MALTLWITLAVAGCVGAIAVATSWFGNRPVPPPEPVNQGEGARLATTSPSPSPSPTGTKERAVRGSSPVTLSIPSIDATARVVPVGVTAEGDVQIPEKVSTVGWYRYSVPVPSTRGSTVLVGHVDSAAQGQGAFFRLRELSVGDRVEVRTTAGRTVRYRVISREQFPKRRIDLDPYFSLKGVPRLTMITCGGSFDRTLRSYRDNVIVTAVPA